MQAQFTHEDAIILGMLFAKYFPAYVYSPLNRGGLGDVTFGGFGWTNGQLEKVGTGRGGDSNCDGDWGKPLPTDATQKGRLASGKGSELSGGPGSKWTGGPGLFPGQFGFGGGNGQGWLTAGGGSGWFGGGSSIIGAGGGGGSSFCLNINDLEELDNKLRPTSADGAYSYVSPTQVQFIGEWLRDYPTQPFMMRLNSRLAKKYEGASGYFNTNDAYLDFLNMFTFQDGNGFCVISKPNDPLLIDPTLGNNYLKLFTYQGYTEEFIIPSDGDYIIACYGACGGDYARGLEQYMGGEGGYCIGKFKLKAGAKLYINCGASPGGGVLNRPFNGGGLRAGASTSGGGATDVRWAGADKDIGWSANLYTRFIVAGGGGGCNGIPDGREPKEPVELVNNGEDKEDTEEEKKEVTDESGSAINKWYQLNDKSIVYVEVDYVASEAIESTSTIKLNLYMDDKLILTDVKFQNKGGGKMKFRFPVNQVLPPNTPTAWHKIDVAVIAYPSIYILRNGLKIWVETQMDKNESTTSDQMAHIISKLRTKVRSGLGYMFNLHTPQLPMSLENIHLVSTSGYGFGIKITSPIVPLDLRNIHLVSTSGYGFGIKITSPIVPLDLRNVQLTSLAGLGFNIKINTPPVPMDLGNVHMVNTSGFGCSIKINTPPVPMDLRNIQLVSTSGKGFNIKINGV